MGFCWHGVHLANIHRHLWNGFMLSYLLSTFTADCLCHTIQMWVYIELPTPIYCNFVIDIITGFLCLWIIFVYCDLGSIIYLCIVFVYTLPVYTIAYLSTPHQNISKSVHDNMCNRKRAWICWVTATLCCCDNSNIAVWWKPSPTCEWCGEKDY